jgi:hypothetical protein
LKRRKFTYIAAFDPQGLEYCRFERQRQAPVLGELESFEREEAELDFVGQAHSQCPLWRHLPKPRECLRSSLLHPNPSGKRSALGWYLGMEPVGPPEQFDVVLANQVIHLINRDIGIRANEVRENYNWQRRQSVVHVRQMTSRR